MLADIWSSSAGHSRGRFGVLGRIATDDDLQKEKFKLCTIETCLRFNHYLGNVRLPEMSWHPIGVVAHCPSPRVACQLFIWK